ncbi:MAG: hypothetical protein IJ009_01365 [Clostridia bacterium]|nr:hypothetical protein [Clostridia bacterium]
MKRLIAILMLACTLFMLCACPGDGPVEPPVGGDVCDVCGKNPCECPDDTDPKCPTCGQNPCVCPPPAVVVDPVYARTYPYTDDEGVVHIRYQDTYNFGRDIQEITDVVITSTVTGTTEKDANLLVEQKDGQSVYADGCGTATVKFRGNQVVKIQVDPSPINMLFVTGQSNASGDPQSGLKPGFSSQYADDYIRSPETMAYLTWTGQQVSIDPEGDLEDYTWAWNNGGTLWPATSPAQIKFIDYKNYVPTTLDWETASNANGPQPQQLSIPKGQTSFSTSGWNAALAYEWVKQTGERVWIVNCSQGGMEIQHFQPTEDGTPINNEYYQAVAVFNAALETLYKEVDAGHFVLNHMAYYWFHGESNSNDNEISLGEYTGADNRFKANRGNRYLDAEAYTEYFINMHKGFMSDVVYDHNGVTKELEYCGIMTIRTKDGETKNTYDQLKLVGARNSEYYMGASADEALSNVFVVSNVTERWVGETYDEELGSNPEADAAVEAYMLEVYGSAARFKEIFGYDMPTTVYEMHPGVHYLMHGHNEMGMDCARNSLRIIRYLTPENCYELPNYDYEDEVIIRIVGEDGMTELTDLIIFDKTTLKASVCPQIAPLYRQVDGLRIEIVGEGFTFDSNVLTAASRSESFVQFKLYFGDELYEEYAFNIEYR